MVAQLLFLEADNPDKPIQLYINSPGGYVTAGLAIYDTMQVTFIKFRITSIINLVLQFQFIKPTVSTVCAGQAASMGSLLLTAGATGHRHALPNSRIMIHQPIGGYHGQASDIEIHAKEILSLRDRLNKLYVKHTGKKLEEIEDAVERDYFLSPQEAVNFGLIDKVISSRKDQESS